MLILERLPWTVCTACILALCASTSMAQDPKPDAAPVIPGTDEQRVEEIVVKGKKSLRQIRREIRILDLQIYSIFNELNTDDDYDIVCKKTTRIGSKIVRNDCRAKLYWDSLSELAEETDGGILNPRPVSNPQKHTTIFRAKLAALADENAALRKVLVQRKRLADEEKAKLGRRDD